MSKAGRVMSACKDCSLKNVVKVETWNGSTVAVGTWTCETHGHFVALGIAEPGDLRVVQLTAVQAQAIAQALQGAGRTS
jgi:hypothetical protein